MRQYIGARYVPKFFDNPDGTNTWLEGVAYEPLTIVSYAGNAYTSKKPVPATVGAPNVNTEYWVYTGTSSGAIGQLTQEVADLQSDVTELDGRIDNVEDDLGVLPTVGQNCLIIVGKDQRFTTVNDAIDYVRQYMSTKRVTIAILSGTYNESISVDTVSDLTLVGIGDVTIQADVPWPEAALRCSRSIYCQNIKFYNLNTHSGTKGYAVHADPLNGIQTYVNCTFNSAGNAGFGLGNDRNGELRCYNCRFTGMYGLYMHNRNASNILGQWARFYQCRFEGYTSGDFKSCIKIDDQSINGAVNSQMACEFIGCTGYPRQITYLFNGGSQHYLPDAQDSANGKNIWLWQSCHGNNMPGLEYGLIPIEIDSYFYHTQTAILPWEHANDFTWTNNSSSYCEDASSPSVAKAPDSISTQRNQIVAICYGMQNKYNWRCSLRGIPKDNLV